VKLGINIEIVFRESEIKNSFQIISNIGLKYFEIWNWKNYNIDLLINEMKIKKLKLSCISGNRINGLVDINTREAFLRELKENIQISKRLGCRDIMILSEVLAEDLSVIPSKHKISNSKKYLTIYDGLSQAAHLAKKEDVVLHVELLNTIIDHPGYYLNNSKVAFELIEAVNNPNLKVLYDIYHMQIMEGNLINNIESNLDKIGHIHVADVPGRNEPGTGEINYHNIARALKVNGYKGFVILEAYPKKNATNAIKAFQEAFEV
jgi:hydroxypyruvate isomerase